MPPEPTLSTMSLNRIKSVLMVMTYIFKEKGKYLEDYRLSLVKTVAMRQNNGSSVSVCVCVCVGGGRKALKVCQYTSSSQCCGTMIDHIDTSSIECLVFLFS